MARDEQVGHLDQRTVAERVAIHVVDLLEVVDVEDGERERLAIARGGLHRGGERAVEVAAIVEAGEPVARGEVEQALGAAHDGDGQQGGNAQQDEPSEQVDRGVGPRVGEVASGRGGRIAGGVGPECCVLGDGDGADHDADACVVAQAGGEDRQEIHLERDIRVECLERRAHHQEGDQREADEGDVERAGGEADPGAPASAPERGPDGDGRDRAHEGHGKAGDDASACRVRE